MKLIIAASLLFVSTPVLAAEETPEKCVVKEANYLASRTREDAATLVDVVIYRCKANEVPDARLKALDEMVRVRAVGKLF